VLGILRLSHCCHFGTWGGEKDEGLTNKLSNVKQCHKPPMTGNGNHTTYENGDLGDGLLLFYPHYK
jgi:hypothetical protein